ncbi:nicotinic acid mononucleotide adenyltransferase [Cytophaga sp. FL35]|uniref:nicotinic acid mononucleotide adenyltransferase n=1 Tax=Cytophaga sp. FL35 TaxID=1904456 RepID=UPI0016535C44|nr:nicotinic acid mononucleotide adenyltransferase [Cytophaga sp. FL35]MBC6997769.1 nicotinic acid mononucleotide adenyltransferase [Cytophaga sp. FL35]
MKIKILNLLFVSLLLSSCYTEVLIEDSYIDEPAVSTESLLRSHDLWYVDITATQGAGEVAFMEYAFTLSFVNGTLYANNKLVGIGKTGSGLGIDVGFYESGLGEIQIDHDVYGRYFMDVFVVDHNTLELYDSLSDTSYFLEGYQMNEFDFDYIFYDNLSYFLQEYDVWEKVYTSQEGMLNDFDNENFLSFNTDMFQSSIDAPGTPISNLQWDFEGEYRVYDTAYDEMLKTLTLAYRSSSNDYFELYVINDSTVELYHPSSETVYRFKGRGYRQYLKSSDNSVGKKRIKTSNPVMKVERSRK